ncbi:MAG: cell wall-active antibiotics response protein LiaF [Anaerolineae bacterium]
MKSQGQIILGVALIAVGLLAILDRWLGISLGRVFFPLLLIALGVWIMVRPSRVAAGTRVAQQIFGDVVRKDAVASEDILVLIGDVKIDWRAAEWPFAPVHLHISGLLGDIRVKLPQHVGVSLEARSAIGSMRLDDRKQDAFFALTSLRTDGYEDADQQLAIEVTHLLGDVRVERGPATS